MVVMGIDYSLIGAEYRGGKLFVSQATAKDVDKGTSETRTNPIEIASREFYLRGAIGKDAVCRISVSVDGTRYTDDVPAVMAREGKWIGAKVGVACAGPGPFNDAGTVDIDWFRFE